MNTVQSFNRRVFWVWLAGIGVFLAAGIGWDLYLYHIDPTGEHTISWSVAVMTAENPGLAFLMGLGTGAIVAGLASHFWFGQMQVNTWMQLQDVRTKCLRAADSIGAGALVSPDRKAVALYDAARAIEEAFPHEKDNK